MPAQYGRAAFNFRAAQDGDLGFKEDEIIKVIEKDESGWWIGEHCTDGRRGEFPFNYIELISEEEASRLEAARAKPVARAPPVAPKGKPAVTVRNIKVCGSEVKGKALTLKLEVELGNSVVKKIKRTIAQIRLLDAEARKVVPGMERGLPPMWADQAKLGSLDTVKREQVVEMYLSKFIGGAGGQMDPLLLAWLGELPKGAPVGGAAAAACSALTKIGSDSRAGEAPGLPRIPALALVEFTWSPQDNVELYMQEGQLLEVVTQDTGSLGWWQGRTVDGQGGLFPYNHVELLDERVAAAVAAGTSVRKAQAAASHMAAQPSATGRSSKRISLGLFSSGGASKKKEEKKKKIKQRQRRVEQNFMTCSCDSFDRLMDNGFTMEENGKVMSMSPPKDAPKEGDFCQLSYCGFVWDCQKQTLVEVAASDNPSKLAPEGGPLEFFVGAGEVIKGIDYAVQRMRKGQSCKLIVQPQLAYGVVGVPQADIPSLSHLVYELTLEDFGNDNGMVPPPPNNANGASSDLLSPTSSARKQGSTKPPRPSQASKPGSGKPPRPSQASKPSGGGGGGGGGSLADAIALRRAKVDQQAGPGVGFVAERAPRANRMTRRMDQEASSSNELRGPTVEEDEKPTPQKIYTLKELQEIVRDKRMAEKNLAPETIEDALTDEEFEKAFKMSRTEFLLKPRWRQQALKRGVRLF